MVIYGHLHTFKNSAFIVRMNEVSLRKWRNCPKRNVIEVGVKGSFRIEHRNEKKRFASLAMVYAQSSVETAQMSPIYAQSSAKAAQSSLMHAQSRTKSAQFLSTGVQLINEKP
ncbi:hypothetical protein CHH80_19745 [Bacillus sp. 7504-2]|nr:hypothetical protein CHH80_19745 [Bacillus sp. 7504-2]